MSERLVHRLREPAGEAECALVLNHGRGADENDLFGLLDALDPERRLLAVTTGAPLTDVPPGGRHWYLVERVGYPEPRTFASSYRSLTGFLDGLLAERGIGWDRTVIGGFSMGAVMSYAVARRANEIGIRLAIGAARGDVLRMVLREAAILTGAGLVLGSILAVLAGSAARTLLFGLRPDDLTTMGIAVAILGSIGLVAGFVPARRASRLDPSIALRDE